MTPAVALRRMGVALAGLWLFLVAIGLLLGGPDAPYLRAPALARLAGLLLAQVAWASASHPVLGLGRRARLGVGAAWGVVLLAMPLLADGIVRVTLAIVAAVLAFKLYDVHRYTARRGRPDIWTFLTFLAVPFPMLLREHVEGASWARRAPGGFPWRGFAGMAAGSALFLGSFRVAWEEWPFLAEHAAKAMAFFVVFTSLVEVLTWAIRRAGGRFPDFTNRPLLARTPAEFWRRYNIPVGRYLYEDVFKPVGGLRYPALGTLAAFAVSGLGHEYIFSVAVGRVQGYQMLFFLLSGLAVAATGRMRPRGAAAYPAIVATLAFVLVSSALFFMSFQGVVPFYSDPPAWLAGW